ncbi:MAG: DNA mismatch repair protein MutS [Alphaproteobacteria bacterium]|nr:DNA mismatch repair protein MutS [Alphaproteobacteria bacterium]
MAQYFEIKKLYPDNLLFYRMGDFYEMFFEDALIASQILGIALTKRGKQEGEDIPMCGIPAHAVDSYLPKLIRQGLKIAICEQTETPQEAKKRGYKAVVNREVVRVITPGTLTEENLLQSKSHHFLAALVKIEDQIGFSWFDISTGDFYSQNLTVDKISTHLARLIPSELLISEDLLFPNCPDFLHEWKLILSSIPSTWIARAERTLIEIYGLKDLKSLGHFTSLELSAAGVIVEYLKQTQKDALPYLSPLKRQTDQQIMDIDPATRRSLELTKNLAGNDEGNLLSVIDYTCSNPGGRKLHGWLNHPLLDCSIILERQDGVQFFIDQKKLREELRQILKHYPDMPRALSRLMLNRNSPRDLGIIKTTVNIGKKIQSLFVSLKELPDFFTKILKVLDCHSDLCDLLEKALIIDLPMTLKDGHIIAAGYDQTLDEWRNVRDNSKKIILELESTYKQQFDAPFIKIKYNNILGYYLEATVIQVEKLKKSPYYDHLIHRQTLANNLRFTTIDLKALEEKINAAIDKVQELESHIFYALVHSVKNHSQTLSELADVLATLDVFSALAFLAEEKRYCRPIVDESTAFLIEAGRHPVVEEYLERNQQRFIPNNCDLGDQQKLWLVTGPNMAGKSTFLRQNALIAILAQIGSFVPAKKAHIGIITKLFSRVGASDDLARGQSTFMVEMVETASILNQANNRSLVILDEIGRGTATFDGLSIAWAVLEYLHNVNQCRTLFSTHYHELTNLTSSLNKLACYSMKVKEWQDHIVFLHEVIAGSSDRSYGLYVGRIAGLPKVVLHKAQQILTYLESDASLKSLKNDGPDFPLFQSRTVDVSPSSFSQSELEKAVHKINVDELSPRQALDTIYMLKDILKNKES